MRLAMLLVIVVMVGCVAGEPARRSRWPTHRTEKDQKIDELLTRVDKLEKQLADLQAYVSKLHVRKAQPVTPDATPPAAPTAAPQAAAPATP